MKKLGLLFSLFVLLTAFMCENEPIDSELQTNTNNNPNTQTGIVGDWQLESITYNGVSETEFQGINISTTFDSMSENEAYNVSFNADGTYSASGSYDIVQTVTVAGVSQTVTNNLQSTSNGNYTATDTTLSTDGEIFSIEIDGVTQPSNSTENEPTPYTLSPDGNTLTFSSNTTQTSNEDGVVVMFTVNSTSVLTRVGSSGGGGSGGGGSGGGGGNTESGCTFADFVDQPAEGNFKGVDFTIQDGTHRVLGNSYYCRIYVTELTGGDCAFPQFGGNEGAILFSLPLDLTPQTITLSDIAGEGETLNFNSISQGVTFAELAECGELEIISNTATTVEGRVIAKGQEGSTINGNFTLTLCED